MSAASSSDHKNENSDEKNPLQPILTSWKDTLLSEYDRYKHQYNLISWFKINNKDKD